MEYAEGIVGTIDHVPQHQCVVPAGLIGSVAHFQHPPVVACGILPRGKGRRACVAALKHHAVRGAVVGGQQVKRRIQIPRNAEIPGHGIPALLHRAEVGTGACRAARVRAALIHAQRLRQLYRPAELHRARRLRHLAKGHPAAILIEVHHHLLGADGDRLLDVIKVVLQPYLEVVAAQGVEGLGEQQVGGVHAVAGWGNGRRLRPRAGRRSLVVHRAGNGVLRAHRGYRPAHRHAHPRAVHLRRRARAVAALRREFGQRGRRIVQNGYRARGAGGSSPGVRHRDRQCHIARCTQYSRGK